MNSTDNQSKLNQNIAEFWSWFQDNERAFRVTNADTKRPFNDLLDKLCTLDERLRFEVCLNCDPKELIISAEGHIELFELVEDIAEAAPPIKEWVFIALKPAMGFGFRTTYKGVEYDPAEMWFLPLQHKNNPAMIGIRVGIQDYLSSHEQEVRNAIIILLRTALGERSAALDIAYLEVAPLPVNPAELGFIEFRDLADYIEWKKRENSKKWNLRCQEP